MIFRPGPMGCIHAWWSYVFFAICAIEYQPGVLLPNGSVYITSMHLILGNKINKYKLIREFHILKPCCSTKHLSQAIGL